MGMVITITAGLIVWLVLWSIGAKAIDAFMITTVIAILAVAAYRLMPFLPGNRER